ncbi:MAG: hypothetical protein WCP22_03905 [Chlamydiota bacterium]
MRRNAAGCVLMCAALICVYGLTRSHSWTWDSMCYSWSVERGALSGMHQLHLLHEALFQGVYRTVLRFGLRCRALDVGQWMGIVAAALGAGVYFRLLTRVLRDRFWALVFALALAFSYAYWYWASQAEVYTLSCLVLLFVFGALLDFGERPTSARAATAGAWCALSILLQEANALMAVVGLYAVCSGAKRRGARAGGAVVCFLVCACVPAAAVYAAWARFVAGETTLAHAARWSLGGAATGHGGGGQWSLAKLPLVAVSFGKAIVNGGQLNQAKVAPLAAFLGVAVILCVVAAWPRARARAPLAAGICAIWAAIYGALAALWYPDLLKFWIAVLAPVYVILALGAASIDARIRGARPRFLVRASGVLAVAGLSAVNLKVDILPARDPSQNAAFTAAAEIARQTSGDDLIVVPSGMVMWSLRYFDGRPESFWVYDPFERLQGARFRAAARDFGGRIDAALGGGRAVYLCPEVWEPDPGTLASKGIRQDEFAGFWAPYRKGAARAVSYRWEKGGTMREMSLYRLARE